MARLALILALLTTASVATAQSRKCTCREGNGSYLFLRCPKAAPADPDPCPAAYKGLHPKKNPPKAWNDACWQSPRMACFLRRHAASWGITCSLCFKKKCCPFNNWHNCPWCHGEKKDPSDHYPELEELQAALKVQRKIGGKRIEMAASPRYVFITDIRGLKIATAGGGPRWMDKHEMLHLYLQRAEMARDDWIEVFGAPSGTRSMIILTKSVSTQQAFSSHHFGNARTNLLYGSGRGRLPMGAGNGFVLDGRSDDVLHFNCRHMIGHLCISTYAGGGVHEKYLPQWIFRGAAHWLCKLHPRARDHAYFCSYEGVTVSGSGSRWGDKARKIAARGADRDPVERMLQAATATQMNYRLHVRAWSWFDIFTKEEPEPFVEFIKLLRDAQEARTASKQSFGQAPEYVDDRWRERVLGRRRKVTVKKKEAEREIDADAASKRELRSIANELDLQLLAGKIRGLERCQNVRTARLLVSMVDSRNSDRVREVIALVLGRTNDEEVLDYLRGKGFKRAGKLGRATLGRTFGELKDEKAVPLLRGMLADSYWLARANACRALARLGDSESISTLAQMSIRDAVGKVKIAAMDALGSFGKEAEHTTPLWERNLLRRVWQIQVATCDNLRRVGSTKPVDLLIGRLDQEGGRVHDAIRQSLKALTGVDKDWRAETWRKWWVKQKRFAKLEKKMREAIDKDPPKPTPTRTPKTRYATQKKPPTYYGLKVYARAVGYVLDVSASMSQGFRVSEAMQRRLGRKYTASTRIGVCKEELAQSIRSLDPRTRINMVFFSNRVRKWQSVPVPAGSMGENAISAVKNVQPNGQTNYYDALRAILGMEDGEIGGGWRAAFADTPDTLFFLTDGTPTDGEITKADELLSWFNERNRFARLRVHVIAMGNTGVDLEFLSKLAKTNDGFFVHMTGRY